MREVSWSPVVTTLQSIVHLAKLFVSAYKKQGNFQTKTKNKKEAKTKIAERSKGRRHDYGFFSVSFGFLNRFTVYEQTTLRFFL